MRIHPVQRIAAILPDCDAGRDRRHLAAGGAAPAGPHLHSPAAGRDARGAGAARGGPRERAGRDGAGRCGRRVGQRAGRGGVASADDHARDLRTVRRAPDRERAASPPAGRGAGAGGVRAARAVRAGRAGRLGDHLGRRASGAGHAGRGGTGRGSGFHGDRPAGRVPGGPGPGGGRAPARAGPPGERGEPPGPGFPAGTGPADSQWRGAAAHAGGDPAGGHPGGAAGARASVGGVFLPPPDDRRGVPVPRGPAAAHSGAADAAGGTHPGAEPLHAGAGGPVPHRGVGPGRGRVPRGAPERPDAPGLHAAGRGARASLPGPAGDHEPGRAAGRDHAGEHPAAPAQAPQSAAGGVPGAPGAGRAGRGGCGQDVLADAPAREGTAGVHHVPGFGDAGAALAGVRRGVRALRGAQAGGHADAVAGRPDRPEPAGARG